MRLCYITDLHFYIDWPVIPLVLFMQVMPGGYPNGHGVYSPAQGQYSTSGFHPSNPFYCADPQRPGPGPYPNQGCPAEQSSGPSGQPHSQHQHHHYPGPHCQGVSSSKHRPRSNLGSSSCKMSQVECHTGIFVIGLYPPLNQS